MPKPKANKLSVKGAPTKEQRGAPRGKKKKLNAAQKFYGSYSGY
jgi:hypothetical protein